MLYTKECKVYLIHQQEGNMAQYIVRYDGGSYIGKSPIYNQAMDAATRIAASSGLSVLVTREEDGETREIVVHPDGDITHLWDRGR